MPFAPIKTRRLVLRPLTIGDTDAVFGVLGHEPTTADRSWHQSSLEEARGWVERRIQDEEEHGFSMWAIERNDVPGIVGFCGFFTADEPNQVELGYVVHADHWGKGFGTEAAGAAVDAATAAGLRVLATIRSTNERSIRVAERIGLRETGTITDERGLLLVWGGGVDAGSPRRSQSSSTPRTVSDEAMTRNIYDDPDFLAGYQQLPRSVNGLDGAPEWPALRDLLPDLDGANVVDLGCGFGWFTRWASAAGAASVLGLDVSASMLDRSISNTNDSKIEYRRADLETVGLPRGAFDCAFSSLTLHYLADLSRLAETVFESLAPGGSFVFSVEHPIFTAPSSPGYIESDGTTVGPLDSYLDEGTRTTNWFAGGVRKQHRTIGTYLDTLIDAGFAIVHVEEWGPTDQQLAEHPEWINERQRPPLLLVACRRV